MSLLIFILSMRYYKIASNTPENKIIGGGDHRVLALDYQGVRSYAVAAPAKCGAEAITPYCIVVYLYPRALQSQV